MPPAENIIENSLPKLPKLTKLGMTLIELLIVLGILAALAGMTLSLVSEMDTSNRQNTTKNKLEQLQTAIIGTPEHYSKFINDTGRLPVIVEGEGKQFSELWDNNLFEPARNIELSYNGYNNEFAQPMFSVTLNVGWKGPYLNVPNGKLFDGFGNDFWIEKDINNLDSKESENFWNYFNSVDSEPISIIKFGSRGEDGEDDTDDQGNPKENLTWQNKDDKREIKSSNFFATLHVKILLRDSSTAQTTWLPPAKTSDKNGYKKYIAAQQLYQDEIVLPAAAPLSTDTFQENDLFFRQPDTTTNATTWTRLQTFKIDDNYLRWLPYSYKLNRLRVVVFSPHVSKILAATDDGPKKTADIKITTAFYNFDSDTNTHWKLQENENEPENLEDQTAINEVTFYNLTPGIRKIFAYGYVNNTSLTTISNKHQSNLQTIELKAGENFITIYLNE
jgi:prepilin-type N-terminal cleavage/methylation domain-containing protein